MRGFHGGENVDFIFVGYETTNFQVQKEKKILLSSWWAECVLCCTFLSKFCIRLYTPDLTLLWFLSCVSINTGKKWK